MLMRATNREQPLDRRGALGNYWPSTLDRPGRQPEILDTMWLFNAKSNKRFPNLTGSTRDKRVEGGAAPLQLNLNFCSVLSPVPVLNGRAAINLNTLCRARACQAVFQILSEGPVNCSTSLFKKYFHPSKFFCDPLGLFRHGKYLRAHDARKTLGNPSVPGSRSFYRVICRG